MYTIKHGPNVIASLKEVRIGISYLLPNVNNCENS